MDAKRLPPYVTVTTDTEEIRALGQPQFLIQVGAKYYATLAVLEYDTEAMHLEAEQQRYLPTPIRHLFAEAATHGVVHGAVNITSQAMLTGGSTKPPPH